MKKWTKSESGGGGDEGGGGRAGWIGGGGGRRESPRLATVSATMFSFLCNMSG